MSNKLLKEANQMLKFWCLDSSDVETIKFNNKYSAEIRKTDGKFHFSVLKDNKLLGGSRSSYSSKEEAIRAAKKYAREEAQEYFETFDADNIEERAKKKLAEGGRIQVIAPNGDRCSVVRAGENMVQSWSEKRHQWESFPLSKCKILSVDATPFELRMIENNERMLAKAKKDLEKAKQDYSRHKDDPFWKELLIDAQNDVKRAEENLERSKRQATKDASPEEVARKREIERLSAFIKKHPVGSDNPMISRDLRKAKERLSELLDKKKTGDNDATENGSIKEYGQNKETEVMPLEKKPVLAQDESKREELERRIKDLEKEDYIDTFVMGDKPNPKTRKLIQQLKEELKKMPTKDEKTYQNGEHVKVVNHSTGDKIELKVLRDNKDGTLEVKAPTGAVLTIKKTWIVDASIPLFKWTSQIGRKELKDKLDDLKRRKQTLERAISGQEHYYTNPKTKQDQQELAEIEMQISTVQHMLSKVTHDECMEVLRLSGFATDAYDPKKYEGTRRHETNIWYLENEVTKWRSRYESAKDQVTAYRKMVSSGQYGKLTTEDLKRAERDLEAARMKLEQSLSMLQRAKGQKDEAPNN